MKATTNRDIERLRSIAARGGRKCDAVREMGRPRDFVDLWTKRAAIKWSPKKLARPSIGPAVADLAMARLCNTMAALTGFRNYAVERSGAEFVVSRS